MSDLLQLEEQCQEAAGPDRRLDALVQIAVDPDREVIVGTKPGRFPRDPIYGPVSDLILWLEEAAPTDVEAIAGLIDAPQFTASIDAAMTLVPEGLTFSTGTGTKASHAQIPNPERNRAGRPKPSFYAVAATPALALCAAALKARAALAKATGETE